MIHPWTASRAKRAAISTIAPLVDSSRARLGGIPATAWQEPYLLGFMSMLIALVATQHARGRLRSDQLGLIQVQAFARLTGVQDDRIGEQICFLSALDDESFLAGCRNAWLFLKAYNGAPDSADAGVLETATAAGLDLIDDAKPFGRGGLVAAAIWQSYFEQHLL